MNRSAHLLIRDSFIAIALVMVALSVDYLARAATQSAPDRPGMMPPLERLFENHAVAN